MQHRNCRVGRGGAEPGVMVPLRRRRKAFAMCAAVALAVAASSAIDARADAPQTDADHMQAITPVDVSNPKAVRPTTPAETAVPAAQPTPRVEPAAAPTAPVETPIVVQAPVAPPASGPAVLIVPAAPVEKPVETAQSQSTSPASGTATAAPATTVVRTGDSVQPATSQGAPTSQVAATRVAPDDGPVFRIAGIDVGYAEKLAARAKHVDLANLPVSLTLLADGAYAMGYESRSGRSVPRSAGPQKKISELGSLPTHLFHQSAIQGIEETIVRALGKEGIGGVYVEASTDDLTAARDAVADKDKAAPTLHLVVHMAVVTQVRTIQSGEYEHSGNKIDNPANAAIAAGSPVKPTAKGGDGLFRQEAVADYVLWLNRHPGRRVDVAVAAADQVDGLIMDYLVSERKSWLAFAQVSNTGTSQTNPWRERVGIIDNQLTNHDDILTIDYMTAGFDKSHMVSGSYDFPLPGVDRLRARVFADYSEFTASDVGQGAQQFTGESESVGAELNYNLLQLHTPFSTLRQRDLFVDLVVGGKYMHVRVNNSTAELTGAADLALPYVGFRAERNSESSALAAQINMLSEITGANQDAIDHLGRLSADGDFVILQGNLDYSFYLEPVLAPASYAQAKGTLAHELAFSVKGQYAFDNRLIPQQEQVAGGLYSVRGYPESVVAGDSVIIATGEYRFHIPRVLSAAPPGKDIFGKTFRYQPQTGQPFSTPDWDLIFRSFVDVGQVYNSKRESFEENSTLAGTGVGLELLIRQNISIRADWGVALETLDKVQAGGSAVEAGSNRFHMVFTFTY